jgi:uncharacterized protein YegP (UPF0339 family)
VARFQCFRVDQQQVRWRLLGSNNRVLGVSPEPLRDHATAIDEVDLVRKRIGEAEFSIEHVHSGLWWWRMTVDDTEVARSSRGFARRVDAVLAYGRFRQRVPEAETDLTLVVFQPGRRGREVTSDDDSPTQPVAEHAVMRPQRSIG